MTQDEALKIFEQTGALLKGHFILRSGLHSREFFQCALALQQMPIVEQLGAGLAAQMNGLGATTVVAPAMGGLVIGQEVARQLGLRYVFVEKEKGKLVLRRGFKIESGVNTVDRRRGNQRWARRRNAGNHSAAQRRRQGDRGLG